MTEKEKAIRTLEEQLEVAKQALFAHDESHEKMLSKYEFIKMFEDGSEDKYKEERQMYLSKIGRLHNDLQIAKR